VTAEVKRRLKDRFGIAHATVEVEYETCADERLSEASANPYRPR
jgi:hypothetical protein